MADAIVSFAVERLGDFLIQEAVFLGGVRNEMQLIKNELEWIVCFIKDAEEKQDDDPLVRKWVSDIRDIAYDIEDVLDKFLLKVDDGETPGQRMPGFLPSIRMCACIFSEGKEKVNLYRTGKKIEDLRKRISDLTRKRERYGLKNIDSKSEGTSNSLGRLKQLRRATSFAVEENVVGFEDDANKLLAKLLEEEPRRFLISIFGMGGLGKTTLARKLCHSDDVKNKFDCCAWVSVSQDYQTEDLLLRIIKSFNIITSDHLERMREEDLERYLHNSLQGRSYLVVIDDVWKKEAWESLKRAFPDNKNRSRVIITTRIKEVAERSDERTHFHELRFLRPDESWQLFSEKAFRNTNADEGLEKLGREMVQKCNGLPLAIVVLGGLLSTKKPQEWRIVRDNIWRHLRNDSIHISNLLALSFNDLSYQLKLCFLYLGLFPEDYEINIEKLIKLLVAEGLIAQDYDRVLEDVAKHNLEQLINRSLIQLDKRCWGRIATCRLHDLLRDLAIQKARELNFLHIYDQIKNTTCSSSMSSCRRQAFYSRIEYSRLQQWNPLSRSLLLFNQRWDGNFRITEHLAPLCARFTFLRVLDIEAAEVTGTRLWRPNYLTEKIAKLIHLKYLGLRNSRIYKLPPSIINLQKLQTLDLFNTTGHIELPTEISKLQELRHLIGVFRGALTIEDMTNLQTLKYVQYGSWIKVNTDKLINFRELHIEDKDGRGKEVFTFDSIAKLESLQILSVSLQSATSFASLQPLLSHCQNLIDLRLKGKLKNLPEDMHELLQNLECLSLRHSYLEKDPMPVLEKMLSLTILDLGFYSYGGRKLTCTESGFPRLEILRVDLYRLKKLHVEEGSMPMLRGLSITGKSSLKIPERLRSIPLPAEWKCQEDYHHSFYDNVV